MSKKKLQSAIWTRRSEERTIWTTEVMPDCPRCGGKHTNIDAVQFIKPVTIYGHTFYAWGTCPRTNEPFFLEEIPE